MRAILSREPDWEVCGEATTGRQALAQAFELKPDVMILDVGLPELNGLEVTRRVRRDLPVAVLIVTVHDADQIVQEAINAGANGYVLKADAGRVLADGSARRTSERLTSRERELLPLLAEGRANKEIATALGITTKTAETHRAHIMAKLELHSMSELVRYAIRNSIIQP
jgi:DNA-binding NarL/FixJ family response regulator